MRAFLSCLLEILFKIHLVVVRAHVVCPSPTCHRLRMHHGPHLRSSQHVHKLPQRSPMSEYCAPSSGNMLVAMRRAADHNLAQSTIGASGTLESSHSDSSIAYANYLASSLSLSKVADVKHLAEVETRTHAFEEMQLHPRIVRRHLGRGRLRRHIRGQVQEVQLGAHCLPNLHVAI